jgi:hypothetical protein
VKESQLDLYEAGSDAGLSATIAPVAAQLVAAASLVGGERVLDVGAGDGTVSIMAAQAGGVPVACDLSAVHSCVQGSGFPICAPYEPTWSISRSPMLASTPWCSASVRSSPQILIARPQSSSVSARLAVSSG